MLLITIYHFLVQRLSCKRLFTIEESQPTKTFKCTLSYPEEDSLLNQIEETGTVTVVTQSKSPTTVTPRTRIVGGQWPCDHTI